MPAHREAIAVQTHGQLYPVESELVITLSTSGQVLIRTGRGVSSRSLGFAVLLECQALKPSGTSLQDPAFAHPDSRPTVKQMRQRQMQQVFCMPGIRPLPATLFRARRQLQVQDIDSLVASNVPLT